MSPLPNEQAGAAARERVALVTGTSSGFGMLTVLELARKRFRVIATMRNLEAAIELQQRAEREGLMSRIELHQLDVTDHAAIEQVVAEIVRVHQRIDVLVNNAGFAMGGFVEEVPMEEWRQQMETNFFGLIAVSKSVIPIMRTQRSGMIINISSVSGRVGFPGYAPYASSKFAVEGFSESLRHELAPFGVKVVLVEPGAYRTPIWDKGLAQLTSSAHSPYAERLNAIVRYSRKTAEAAPDPQQVADTISMLVDSRAPKLRYPLGRGARIAILGKALLPWKWFEWMIDRGTR